VQFGDEHRRHAVERGAALLLDGLQGGHRVEGGGGDDDAGAVGGGRQVAHDHAEAVVEGHRQTDAVLLAVADGTAHPVAVVEDVVVGEGGPLGEAGGARGVLDVHRVVAAEAGGDLVQPLGRHPGGGRGQRVPARVADVDRLPQLRAPSAHLVDQGAVVAALVGQGG